MSTLVLIGSAVLAGVLSTGQAAPGASQEVPASETERALQAARQRLQEELLSQRGAVVNPMNPQVVCGMKLWYIDPPFDAGIREPLPEAAAGASIRRIPPDRDCVPNESAAWSHSFTISDTIPAGRKSTKPVRK